jgi:L,D-transpeptidase ErfK/SrfK
MTTLLFFSFLLYAVLPSENHLITSELQENSTAPEELKTQLSQNLHRLKSQYRQLQPKRPYLTVNTAENLVTLYAKDLKHEAKCSTGSYILLRATDYGEWLFKTPRGVFRVTVKLRSPSWYKPDWAFIEEGLPVPSLASPKRYQDGVLGDYAVAFGQGYLVHGTLYKRLLGMPVTHGCVRLDDEDMSLVFKNLTHGSKIFIF